MTPISEHRRQPRQRTYKAARILFNGRRCAIDGIVRNLSEAGACLEVATPIGIPPEFEVLFESNDIVRRCGTIWRTGNRIGVAFRASDSPT
jgi:hypothetical protein